MCLQERIKSSGDFSMLAYNSDNCPALSISLSETGWMHSGPSYFAELTIVKRRERPLALREAVSTLTGLWRKAFEKHRAIALPLPPVGSRACGCVWVRLDRWARS